MSAGDRPTSGVSYEVLHQRARELIDAGALPVGDPCYMYGGWGIGRNCELCGAPVTSKEIEYELEFETANEQPTRKFLLCLHLGCHAIWDYERKRSR
jgi:hypothetical protein